MGAEDGGFSGFGCGGWSVLRIWEVVWVSVRRIVGSLGLGAEDGRFSGFGGFVLGKKWGGWVWGNKVEGVSIG